MERFKKQLTNRDKMLNLFYVVIGMGAIGILLPVVYISVYILPILFLYLLILWPVFVDVKEEKEFIKMLRYKVYKDPEGALHKIQVEINDITQTITAPKSEMDIHALNATDERKAMRASVQNEKSLRKKLAYFIRLEEKLIDAIKNLEPQVTDPFDY